MSHLNPSVVSVGFWERLQQPFVKTWALTSCFLFFFLFFIKLRATQAFSLAVGCGGCALAVVRGLLTAVASLVVDHGL